MPHRTLARAAVVASALCWAVPNVLGQNTHPLAQMNVAASLDSGPVINLSGKRDVIFSGQVQSKGAPWIRVMFNVAELGEAPAAGEPTMLRMTSLLDGAVQTMYAMHLQQWQNTSAYFNGDAVQVEVIADADAAPSHIAVTMLIAGVADPDDGGIATICGSDDRVLSFDPRAARIYPVGCTAWIFNDANHTFLTAGHCAGGGLTTIEFNVPLSQNDGSLVHPPPQDQYAVDPVSVQSTAGGLGNDWCYFGCFANPNTNLTPFQKQQAFYVIAATAPPVNGQSIRITGYGVDSSPQSYNQVQQTSAGPYTTLSGTIVRYQCDTTGGNSGSAVLDESTQLAIGIHTNGGCSSSGGENSGCAIHAQGLQNALDNPHGVCIPLPTLCPADIVRNKAVNIDDLLAVINNWGAEGGGIPADCAPLGGNGAINIDDLLFVINDWGPCPF